MILTRLEAKSQLCLVNYRNKTAMHINWKKFVHKQINIDTLGRSLQVGRKSKAIHAFCVSWATESFSIVYKTQTLQSYPCISQMMKRGIDYWISRWFIPLPHPNSKFCVRSSSSEEGSKIVMPDLKFRLSKTFTLPPKIGTSDGQFFCELQWVMAISRYILMYTSNLAWHFKTPPPTKSNRRHQIWHDLFTTLYVKP